MPSPIIPRSKSVPDIDIASPNSPSDILASSKSVRTTRSTGSPIISWPKKLSDLLKWKANSDLTEKGLLEFNRRNRLIEERYACSSPYSKGLTDFSLDIHRQKLSETSPGRESYVSSGGKTGGRPRWTSSWFAPKKHERSYSSSSSSWTKSSNETRFMTSSSSSSSSKINESGILVTKMRARVTRNDLEFESQGTFISSTMEKPLRERDSERSVLLQPEPLPYPPQQILPSPVGMLSPPTSPPPPPPPPPPQPFPPPAVQAPQPQISAAGEFEYEERDVKTIVNERKYVWADIYRPVELQHFLCNRSTALSLQTMARGWHDRPEECGHFIFEGSPGVGKRTMMWALLREIFGKDKVEAKEESRTFYLKGEAVPSIQVNLTASPHHVEVNLSELKGYEKHVIVELIKGKPLMSDATMCATEAKCKAIILHEADKLSIDALSYIRWMLGKFEGCNKVFFCCSDAKKLQVIKPICTSVQLLEPSVTEILEVLTKIAKEENIELPQVLANKIANSSKNNLRQAIRSFEATWHFSGCQAVLKEDQIIKTGWEDKIANIANNVVEEQSPMQLYYIRGEIKNLIEHNVAPEYIFQTLKEELQKILPEKLQMQFIQLYEEYQNNNSAKKGMLCGDVEEGLSERQHDQKKNVQRFMKIEEFIARFMSWYKGSSSIKNMEIATMDRPTTCS
ncbi:uncharacterized protein LOC127246494 isoform X2 [Andrographis paniculata]|uniref:uncharacterized protein LOC127246494 isoform X2 n=1 Tax=Andrographis paniculata TaxID=175694 RepID=UPI0021E939BA|nr:uncharacterized protein LOC127246494 isoform X2 [Andrographis paniculata]